MHDDSMAFFYITGNIPELQTSPVSIVFHITIEMITAVLLILISILLRNPSQTIKYISVFVQGMLAYTVINSSGYFAQSGDWAFLLMFTALLIFAVVNSLIIIRLKRQN